MAQQKNLNLRDEALREILTQQRHTELAKVQEFRRDQAQETLSVPSDDLDVARSLADIEMHASLIERSEERLKAIDAAFNRLEQDCYGICEQCGNEISLERLRVLPFASYCIDCQERRESNRSPEPKALEQPFVRRWAAPPSYENSVEESDDAHLPEDDLSVRRSAFEPEEGELPEEPEQRPRRGRRRKRD